MNQKLTSVFLFSLMLFGCTTTVPVVVPPVACGADLKDENLQPCTKPSDLPEGATFNQGFLKMEESSVMLKECSSRVELLRTTIQVCREKFEKTEKINKVERRETKDVKDPKE